MQSPPFVLGDPASIAGYRALMLSHLKKAQLYPLYAGSSYTLALKKPILSEVLPCPTVTARRPLQSLPFGVETVYTLSIPVQTGGQWRPHVWLATPPNEDGCSNPRRVVLQFIVPSHLELPALDTQANGAMPSLGRYYRYPDDIVAEGVKAYDSLPELQGATLPYFYGSFQVCPFTHGWLR